MKTQWIHLKTISYKESILMDSSAWYCKPVNIVYCPYNTTVVKEVESLNILLRSPSTKDTNIPFSIGKVSDGIIVLQGKVEIESAGDGHNETTHRLSPVDGELKIRYLKYYRDQIEVKTSRD